ncbi:abortive infection system antitoxin AbiGi family protein [Simiduia curdlanivorans]|uniref:Abortive infection system antitoxin AbiGi family protein n=1 Tax=Simiduia curdlanivorans TaxID=1492769 RepID=A0ABV8V1D0_9GAMM|nr:abortive infection system antitoxin AbiGi family protein [Simiduia curdlanivorans]MDN3637658.1 abortive infection system antitoxin AbiGi family protein [Simiduia curdlanivorans]
MENGFWPRFCYEDISWCSKESFFLNAMVCFCDISLPKLNNHTEFYGRYGIGMTREWGIANGLNPLMYVSEYSYASVSLARMLQNPDLESIEGKMDALTTLAFTKPLSGKMMMGENEVEKDFYEECEWRYVDISTGGLHPDDISRTGGLEYHNESTKSGSLQFEPSDVRYVLVENEEDVTPIVDFINAKMGKFSHNDLKLLVTKIVVLSELRADI